MVKALDNSNFDTEVSSGMAIVDFYADWCVPCMMMSKVIESIADEINEIGVFKVNVDEMLELVLKYKIMTIPTFMIFKNGNVVETFQGMVPKEYMAASIKRHID